MIDPKLLAKMLGASEAIPVKNSEEGLLLYFQRRSEYASLSEAIEAKILEILKEHPQGVDPVTMREHFTASLEGRVRTAITNLWGKGLVNVTPDRKLILVPKE